MSPRATRYRVWLKQAKHDLQASSISYQNGFNEWATYQAEQSVEKALKSVIVHAGENSPKMHKLAVLFGFCNSVNPEFRKTKFEFRHLESFTFISRYPFLLPGRDKCPHELITKQDAEVSIKQATAIVEKIEVILGKKIKLEHEEHKFMSISEAELNVRLEEVKDILVTHFHPEKIVLFGSYARRPLPQDMSTIDLLVIADMDIPFIERIKLARELTRGKDPVIEPLIYTPEEFEVMTEEEGDSFLESALAEGRELYTK